jgi:cytochrome c
MKPVITLAVVLIAVALLAPGSASAADRGTPAEAKAMLAKAVEHFHDVGRDRALSDFTAGKAPFHDRDLYVVCVDSKHVIVANGGYPSFVGSSADALVDANGVPLGKALWDAASKNPNGSIRYPLVNPMTKKLEEKTTFYNKVADDLLCGVGAFSAG